MSKRTLWGVRGILVLTFAYIFIFLLNYDTAWMNPEKFVSHSWILFNGKHWLAEDFTKSLGIDLLELDDYRISRPICNFVEVVNAKVRANLWDHITPHPSLSIVWPFMLLGIPVWLYRFFRNMGCQAAVSLAGVSFYLSSIGFIVPLVNWTTPGKGLFNVGAAWCLYLASCFYKRTMEAAPGRSVNEVPRFWLYFPLLLFSLFFFFFTDETCTLIWIMVAILLYPVFFRFKEWWVTVTGFLLLPVGYILSIKVFLPYLHWRVRGLQIKLDGYRCYPQLTDILSADWWNNFWTNSRWLLGDHPHMQLNAEVVLPNNPWLFFLQAALTLAMIHVLVLLALAIKHRVMVPASASAEKFSGIRTGHLVAAGLIWFGYFFFYTALLYRNVGMWGVWYHGSPYSLVYVILLVFVMQFILQVKNGKMLQNTFVAVVLIVVLHNTAFGRYRLDVMYRQPQFHQDEVFDWRIGPYFKSFSFIESLRKNDCKYLYTRLYWANAKNKQIGPVPAEKIKYCQELLKDDWSFNNKEILYLPIELRAK